MEDNFDEILGDKIRESVSSMDFSYNPEHWNKLKKKKSDGKKRVFLYWRIAGLLVLSLMAGGIGRFLIQNKIGPQIILEKSSDSLRIDTLKNNKHIFITSGGIDSIINLDSKLTKVDSIFNITTPKLFIGVRISENSKLTQSSSVSMSSMSVKTLNKSEAFNINTSLIRLNESVFEKNQILSQSEFILRENLILNKKEEELINSKNYFIKEDISLVLNEEVVKTSNKSKSMQLGIVMAPVFSNDNSGGSSNVGFTGGVAMDLPISKRFDINLGVYYTDQKLNLKQPNTNTSGVSAKGSSKLIDKEAVLRGIEIPLNVKYNFLIDKKQLFLSVGLSSTSYIKESIEANYLVNNRIETRTEDSIGNNIIKYELIQEEEKISSPSDAASFNFGNIINLSFGIEIPLNKNRQSIILEPYYKYSLTPVTNQKFKYSRGGLNLRYNFNLFKK